MTAFGIKGTLLGAVTAGAIKRGRSTWAAIRFAAAFAGGHTTLDQILEKVALGALVGAVVGGALGGLPYAWSNSPTPSQSPDQLVQKSLQPRAPVSLPASVLPSNVPTMPPSEITNFGQAALPSAQGIATKALSTLAEAAAQYMLTSPFATAAITLVVDSSAGLTDLGYALQTLDEIDVVQSPSVKWG